MEKQINIADYNHILDVLALIDVPLIVVSQEDNKIIYANYAAEATFQRVEQHLLKLDIRELIKNEFSELYPLFLDNNEKLISNDINEFKLDNTDLTNKIYKIAEIQCNRIIFFDQIAILVQIILINTNILTKHKIDIFDAEREQQLLNQIVLLNQAEQKNLELLQKTQNLENQKNRLQQELLTIQDKVVADSLQITSLTQEIEILKKKIEEMNINFEQELNKKEQELIKSRNELSDYTNLQSIILANLGHQLRTPLNGILGFAQLIETEEIPQQVYNDVQMIKKAANRLKSTLDNLLMLSEIDANQRKVNFIEFELKNLNDFVSPEYHEIAKIKKLDFEINIRNPNEKINIDPDLLQVVFDVLLDNAFKFTKKGFVKIETENYDTNEGNFVLIKFKDSGTGIAKDKIELIFKPFRQGSEGFEREYQGIGIGLTIAKRILKLMDAEIGVISTLGKGSSFIIQIPKILNQEEK